MKPKEILSYLTGTDYLKKHSDHQQELIAENTGSDEPQLPLDADLKTAVRVHADRLRTLVEGPVVIASRITGVDAAVRKVRELLAEEAKR